MRGNGHDGIARGSRARTCLLVAVLSAVCVALLASSGRLEKVELALSDSLLRSLPSTPTQIVTVVSVDDELIAALGHWPLTDEDLARLVSSIDSFAPRAIAIDLYRDLPVPPGQEKLAQLLRSTRSVYGVSRYPDSAGPALAPHVELAEPDRHGFANLPLDSDGRVRRVLLYAEIDGVTQESLAMRVATASLDKEGIRPASVPEDPAALRLGAAVLRPLARDTGPYVDVDDAGFQIPLDFGAGPSGIPILSARSVLDGTAPSELLRDRVVLLGSTAESVPDVLATPLDDMLEGRARMFGVLVQGIAIDQIVRGARGDSPIIGAWPWMAELATVVALAALGAVTAATAPSAVVSMLAALAGAAGIVLSVRSARAAGLWLPGVAPLLSWLVAMGATTVTLYYTERRERGVLMRMFGHYVSPEIAGELWNNRRKFMSGGRPTPQSLVATVLFGDLQGFTSISERLPGVELMAWLERFMDRMTRTVQAQGGIVDKYVGDAIMAVFGVPVPSAEIAGQRRDACAAVRCALEMGKELRELNRELAAEGLPAVRMRVGIFTGTVLAGSLGSKDRLQYTVIGDAVNTASRLESYGGAEAGPLDNEHPIRILVGSPTHAHVCDEFACTLVGSLSLKGKEQRIETYRVEA